jgi:hypothetical protein
MMRQRCIREITMKITVVKKGSFNLKPVASCPFQIDEDGLAGQKK